MYYLERKMIFLNGWFRWKHQEAEGNEGNMFKVLREKKIFNLKFHNQKNYPSKRKVKLRFSDKQKLKKKKKAINATV